MILIEEWRAIELLSVTHYKVLGYTSLTQPTVFVGWALPTNVLYYLTFHKNTGIC